MEIIERECDQDRLKQWMAVSGMSPLVARLYAARGARPYSELCKVPMLGMDIGARRLACAIKDREDIAVIGDYDTDGATSTALLTHFIRRFGGHVRYLIPDRVQDGYGLSPYLVDRAVAVMPNIKLIITVDNGISAFAGIDRAAAHGIDVIVTDHHLPGKEVPKPYAMINPNQPGCPFPYKSTCGVGVAWYFAGNVWRMLVDDGFIDSTNIMPEYLDLVALGTVADVVPLDENNRLLVKKGLQRIQNGLARQGIKALMSVCGIDPATITEQDFGFRLGPRLNAAGRLEDMSVGVYLLLVDDYDEALRTAKSLDDLNISRRNIEKNMLDQADTVLQGYSGDVENSDAIICYLDKNGHEGVVGLVAGRLRERYHKPALVFSPGINGLLKGSARSVEGVHIRDFLADINAANPGLIHSFGGHAMAAGIGVDHANFEKFRAACIDKANREISSDLLQLTVHTDGVIDSKYLDIEVCRAVEQSGPWGNGFPLPLFDGLFYVVEAERVGKDLKTIKLRVRPVDPSGSHSKIITAIAFRQEADVQLPEVATTVRLLYTMAINKFRDKESLQLMIQAILET